VEMGESLAELNMRRGVALLAVRTARENGGSDEVVEMYQRQLSNIEGKIAELTGRVPDVVVGLKPGNLFGTTKGA